MFALIANDDTASAITREVTPVYQKSDLLRLRKEKIASFADQSSVSTKPMFIFLRASGRFGGSSFVI